MGHVETEVPCPALSRRRAGPGNPGCMDALPAWVPAAWRGLGTEAQGVEAELGVPPQGRGGLCMARAELAVPTVPTVPYCLSFPVVQRG